MSLTAITLRNWRSFKEQRIELRPLTLIYGDNNAGKSALLRAVVALSERPASGEPLAWGSPALRGADFQSLRRRGIADDEDQVLGWALHTDDGRSIGYEVEWVEEWRQAVLRRVELIADGVVSRQLNWIKKREEEHEAERTYRAVSPDGSAEELRFAPYAQLDGGWTVTAPDNAFDMLSGVQWLEQRRRLPGVIQRVLRVSPWLMPEGAGAVDLLDRVPAVMSWVAARFAAMTGYQLRVAELDSRTIKLSAKLPSTNYFVDAAALGDGLQGLVPTLTALGWMACGEGKEGPNILALEEPESQLHPTLQRGLGEAVCEAVAAIKEARTGRKLLIETHSDVLLMTLQLAIARGEIEPEEVAIYWVSQDGATGLSEARRVEIDGSAALGWDWPLDAFEQRRTLAGEIVEAMAVGAPHVDSEEPAAERVRSVKGRRRK